MMRNVTRGFVLLALSIGIDASVAPAQTERVLLVYDETLELPGLEMIDAGLSSTLAARSPIPPQVFREVLELSRFGSGEYVASLRQHLQLKYSRTPPDVIIAVMGTSLDFLLADGDPVFPGTPIVFAGLDQDDLAGRVPTPGVTGVLMERKFAPTVELALRLHPATQRFVFVSGVSDFDVRLVRRARREFAPYADRYEFVYLDSLSLDEMVKRVSTLPPATVLLISTVFRDAAGASFVPHDVVERLATAANRPAYAFVDQFLGRGVVGGYMYSLATHGERAAQLALRILAGEDPAGIPPVTAEISQMLIDARQLERWGIAERRLPENAIVQLRETTFWSRYWRYGLAGSAIIFFQAVIIGALLFQHAKRRRAEAALRDSESRFRILADNAPLMIWMSGPDSLTRYFNRAWLDFIGRVPDEDFGEVLIRSIHPEDFDRCMRTYRDSMARAARFTIEHRMRRHDGVYRWVLCTGAPLVADGNEPRGYIGSCIDITMRKEAEFDREESRSELAHLNRLAAMAELTASLAHELNQPLSALLMNATTAKRLLERKRRPTAQLQAILADIQGDGQRAAEIIRRMRALLQKREMTSAPVEINWIVSEVLQLVGYEAHRRSIAIRFFPGADIPPVLGDRVHLQQVVLNLLLNAFEAVKTAADGERQIRVLTRRMESGTVRISVSDSGPGIQSERMERLFEPFYSTKPDGLGLGLSITRTIVEAHRGAVWAESDGLAGATFHVELPSVLCEGRIPNLTEKCPVRRAATLLSAREMLAAPPAN